MNTIQPHTYQEVTIEDVPDEVTIEDVPDDDNHVYCPNSVPDVEPFVQGI